MRPYVNSAKRLLLGVLFGWGVIAAAPTIAATSSVAYSGNDLMSNCDDQGVNRSFCLGFISGVVNGANVMQTREQRVICVPSGVTVGQLTDIVVRALRTHPESRHMDAGFLTLVGVATTFPCDTPKGK
ncbi:Rap1a/Tai family immunity protein [Pandoraea commovens]|uniref:Rap1a/Tai family immunity protein n=1 Tax=Pandoraea commovens TaxID=2508289 RepID=UPI003CCE1C45